MGYGLISTDRVKKSESAERKSNTKSVLVFSWGFRETEKYGEAAASCLRQSHTVNVITYHLP